MSVTVQLTGTITVTDNLTGSVQLQKQVIGGYTGTISEFAQQQLIGTGSTTINLPISPTQFVYIKNLSASATVTVTWTPNGGASATIVTLQPLSFKILN